jgi:hypothetical protein
METDANEDLGAQVRSAAGRLYRRFRSERPEGSLGDQTVNRLTSAGYAVRTRDPDDRRKVLFSTTAEGDELARAARAQRTAWLDQRLQALSAEDRAVIARAAALLITIADS